MHYFARFLMRLAWKFEILKFFVSSQSSLKILLTSSTTILLVFGETTPYPTLPYSPYCHSGTVVTTTTNTNTTTTMMTTASLLLRALLFSAALLSINGLAAVRKSMFHGTSLVSSTPAPTAVRRTATASSITMRKQKASDKRTRKRQRGDFLVDEQAVSAAAVVASATTLTSSPMSAAGPWQHKATTLPLQLKQQDILLESSGASGVRPKKKTPGRGRSRKRSTLYNSLAFYHNKFLHLLTAEYQAEVRMNALSSTALSLQHVRCFV